MDEFNRNFGRSFKGYAEGGNPQASSEIVAMEVESTDFNSELRRMEKKLNNFKSKLRSCREKYESIGEEEISAAGKMRWRDLSSMDQARSEADSLHERLRDIHLSHDACVKRLDGRANPNETIHANISELTLRRNTLMEELMQLRRNVDDNGRKLAHINAMITEQEEKNARLLRELKKQSGNVTSVPQDVKVRLDAILEKEHFRIRKDDHVAGNKICTRSCVKKN